MLHSQVYTDALNKAANRKRRFDDKVHPVIFKTGDQVQVYDLKLNTTFDTKAKLWPQWSPLVLGKFGLVRFRAIFAGPETGQSGP